MPIHVLPPAVAALIAAGEVVERPASAVKEMVENALDAGATTIAVEISGGGLDLIRVADNGSGIPGTDFPHLFQRHATSKLSSPDDLESVGTLGFRGEALHSLAAVADVTLLSRTASESVGTRALAGPGSPPSLSPSGAPPGTSVTIRGLFRHVPARRKFLRSPQAELSRVHVALAPYVLAYPGVRFSMTAEGRLTLASPGSGDLREAVAAVHGAEVARALLEAQASEVSQGAVWGLLSPPGLTRATRAYVSLFVNRRPVQSRTLAFALSEAYQGFLPGGRHPIAVLFVEVPPDQVDVNVHPAKAEVRLHQERLLFSLVQRAARQALLAAAPVPALGLGSQGPTLSQGAPGGGLGQPLPSGSTGDPGLPREVGYPPPPAGSGPAPPPVPSAAPPGEQATHSEALPALRVLGQVMETYIVAEGPAGLYLIDQHAAHERVLYERLRAAAERRSPDSQGLLAPAVAELSAIHHALAQSHAGLLEAYGWGLAPFGQRSYLVRAVPAPLAHRGAVQALVDLLDGLAGPAEFPSWEERLAATMACHASVRAGDPLGREAMVAMVRQLESARQPHTCPHGRPTMLHLSGSHLERQFHRR